MELTTLEAANLLFPQILEHPIYLHNFVTDSKVLVPWQALEMDVQDGYFEVNYHKQGTNGNLLVVYPKVKDGKLTSKIAVSFNYSNYDDVKVIVDEKIKNIEIELTNS